MDREAGMNQEPAAEAAPPVEHAPPSNGREAPAPAPAPATEAPPASALDELLQVTPPEAVAAPAAAKEFPAVDEVFPEKPTMDLKTSKARENYARQRDAYKALDHALRDANAKLEARAPSEEASARITELESRIAQMSQSFERVAITEHPAFIAQFEKPLADLRAQAGAILKDGGIDPNELAQVFALHGNDRIKAIDILGDAIESPTLRRRLERTMESIEAKEDERGKVMADSKNNMERLTQQEKIQKHQAMEAETKKVNGMVDGIVDHFSQKVKIPFFQKGEGEKYAGWNKQMDADTEEARDLIMNCADESKLSAAILLGVKFPRAMAAYTATRKALLAAEAQIKELRGGRPGLHGGVGEIAQGRNGGSDDGGGDMSVDSIRSRLRSNR